MTISKPSPKLLKLIAERMPSMPVGKFKKINTPIGKKIIFNLINTFIFSIIYYVTGKIDKNAFSKKNITYLESLYFSATTNFTLGFGDFLPVSHVMRFVVILQSIIFYYITIVP